MNVDEAMEAAAGFRADAWTLFSETVAVLLAAEVERLRADLAEAKAASVVPEESAIWLLAVAAKLEKNGEASGLDSMTKAANWLRDRMKDKSPPAT